MRVISGKAKGRKLKAPSRARPLTDQVKEALFNILRDRVADSKFLDLFAGSGAVGIEALSRGAKIAIFAELDRKASEIIRQNLAETGFADWSEIYVMDAVRAIGLLDRRGAKFDLIFLGAPYDSPALDKAMLKLGDSALPSDGGLIIAEHRKHHHLQAEYGKLVTCREAKYGETVLTFYEIGHLSGQL